MENINNILGILAGVLIAGIIVVIIVMFFAIKDHLNDKKDNKKIKDSIEHIGSDIHIITEREIRNVYLNGKKIN